MKRKMKWAVLFRNGDILILNSLVDVSSIGDAKVIRVMYVG